MSHPVYIYQHPVYGRVRARERPLNPEFTEWGLFAPNRIDRVPYEAVVEVNPLGAARFRSIGQDLDGIAMNFWILLFQGYKAGEVKRVLDELKGTEYLLEFVEDTKVVFRRKDRM